jgi:hypothetical protein
LAVPFEFFSAVVLFGPTWQHLTTRSGAPQIRSG